MLKWIWLALLLWASPSFALDLTELGAANLSYPTHQSQSDSSIQNSPALTFGGGISLGIGIWERLEVELGIIYIPKAFDETRALAPSTHYTLTTVQFPLILRYWLSDRISFGGGFYLIHGVGNIIVSQGAQSAAVAYSDLSWAMDDVGVVASFRYKTPISELISIVFDERISIGTSNLDTSQTQNFTFRDLQSWFGIAFIL